MFTDDSACSIAVGFSPPFEVSITPGVSPEQYFNKKLF